MPILLDDEPAFTTPSEHMVFGLLHEQLGPDDLLGAGVRVTRRGQDREVDIQVGLGRSRRGHPRRQGWRRLA